MSNQIGRNNRENSILTYLAPNVPYPQKSSRGKTGNRPYVFVTGKVDKNGLVESVNASLSFYSALEQTMEKSDLKNEGPVRARVPR